MEITKANKDTYQLNMPINNPRHQTWLVVGHKRVVVRMVGSTLGDVDNRIPYHMPVVPVEDSVY